MRKSRPTYLPVTSKITVRFNKAYCYPTGFAFILPSTEAETRTLESLFRIHTCRKTTRCVVTLIKTHTLRCKQGDDKNRKSLQHTPLSKHTQWILLDNWSGKELGWYQVAMCFKNTRKLYDREKQCQSFKRYRRSQDCVHKTLLSPPFLASLSISLL